MIRLGFMMFALTFIMLNAPWIGVSIGLYLIYRNRKAFT